MEPTPADVQVADNPDARRFEVHVGGELAGFAAYRRQRDRVIFTHTKVGDAYSGQGIGTTLARRALDTVRKRKEKVVALCPFIDGFIGNHPEYADLVDVELTAALRRT